MNNAYVIGYIEGRIAKYEEMMTEYPDQTADLRCIISELKAILAKVQVQA